jgi:hypothetical protein
MPGAPGRATQNVTLDGRQARTNQARLSRQPPVHNQAMRGKVGDARGDHHQPVFLSGAAS